MEKEETGDFCQKYGKGIKKQLSIFKPKAV